MANTKISALGAVTGNGAATDEFLVSDGTAVSKKTTLQKIVDFILTRANTFSGANTYTATQTMSGAQFRQAQGADIASAATVNLSAATGNAITITGTTGITAFGTVPAGPVFVLTFAASLTITHNATSLICPNALNIVTQASDQVVVQSLGSGNWRVLIVKPQLISRFRAYRSTTQAIGAAAFTTVVYDTEDKDNLSEYDNTTGIFTAKQSGTYLFEACSYATNADGERGIMTFYVNDVEARRPNALSAGAAVDQSASALATIDLVAGQNVRAKVFYSVAETVEPGTTYSYFSGVRIG